MHVVVIGCGPSGLLVSAALADAGVRVTVLDPAPEKPWVPTYGAWMDELAPVGLSGFVDHHWPVATVRLGGQDLRLTRGYGRIDGPALKAHLEQRVQARGELRRARVSLIRHHDTGVVVHTTRGPVHGAAVIDATGHRSRLVTRAGPPASAFQSAYGVVADLADGSLPQGEVVLMDFDDPGGPALPGDTPTFLYAMPLSGGRIFVEETVLVSRRHIRLTDLAARLRSRLEARGLRLGDIHEVERCRIPMDTPMPRPGQRTIGFGGAASMVHPATGYMLGYVATRAPRVAAALAEALPRGPLAAAQAGWRAVWPAGDRRTHQLYTFGSEMLMDLDADRLRDFFGAFFALPAQDWAGFMSRSMGPAELSVAMCRLAVLASGPIRTRLLQAVWQRPGEIWRGLLSGTPDLAPHRFPFAVHPNGESGRSA